MATTRKAAQQEPGARRGAAKKTSAGGQTSGKARASRDGQSTASGTKRGRQSLRSVALAAAAELAELIGHRPEGIVAVEKADDGWKVHVEVLESRRIPETTDILAVYEVDVDGDGTVTGYRRMDRYVRGRVQD